MKKIVVGMLALLMVIVISVPLSAASIAPNPILTFDIDFYGGDTAYAKDVFDTDQTIDLIVGQTVNVDILFSITEEGVVGGGFDLEYNPSTLDASGLTFYSPFLDSGLSTITPGHVKAEALAWPPGTVVGPGNNNLFITFTFECIGVGLDELWLYDFNTETGQWAISDTIHLDDQLSGGIYLASIQNTPIPGAVWLMGSGLVGLAVLRRRIRN